MHHIAPYSKSQFIISLSIIRKRLYQATKRSITCLAITDFTLDVCTHVRIACDFCDASGGLYLLSSRYFVVFVIQSRVTGGVTSIAEVSKMVAAGKRKISPLTFSLIYGITQLASMHSPLFFLIAMIFSPAVASCRHSFFCVS